MAKRKDDSTPRIGGEPVHLTAPKLLTERWDVAMALSEANGRMQLAVKVFAAALGLCWPKLRLSGNSPRYRGDIMAYGAEVQEFLLNRGTTVAEIIEHGNKACELCLSSIPTESETQAAEGNS